MQVPSARRARLVAAALAVVSALAMVATAAGATWPAPTADAPNTSSVNPHGWFEGGLTWTGDLNDPHIVKVGSTYYAYSSPTGGRYLPVVTSTDLVHWTIHPKYSPIPPEIQASNDSAVNKSNNNDGLVKPAAWGLPHQQGAWMNRDLWAPGVFQIGSTWFAYSAVRIAATTPGEPDPHGYGRFCLTAASAPSPFGPFRDISGSAPIQCQPIDHDPAGSIDPYPYHDPATGKDYLLWKAAGKVGVRESALMSVELGANGLPKPGAPWVTLFETNRAAAWEGGTIENPSMVQYQGTYYLFFAANDSVPTDDQGNSRYAEGYVICPNGPRGGCTQPQSSVNAPILPNTADQHGRAGGNAFIDAGGNLVLSYAYYWNGEVRPEFAWLNPNRHPRRMATTLLARNPDGTLALASAARPGAPSTPTVTAANATVTLSWTAPSFVGGSPVTGYVVTPYVGNVALPPTTYTSPATSQRITGLVNGAVYTFRVAAINGQGIGAQSAVSPSVTPAGAVVLTPTQKFVTAAYTDFLGRAPTRAELAIAGAQIDGGARTAARFVKDLASSPEWATSLVQQMYQDTLGRTGDPGGVAYWSQQISSGARTVASVAANFYASDEYFGGIGGGTDATWVDDLYRKLLGRAPDAGGHAYWVGQVQVTSRVSVALRFFQTAESAHARVERLYQRLLGRSADAGGADYWAQRVVTEGDLALAANLAASPEYAQRAQNRF